MQYIWHYIHLKAVLILPLCLRNCTSSGGVPAKVLYAVITSRVLHAASINFGTRVIQLIIMFVEKYKAWTSSLRNRLHPSHSSFLLSSKVILNTPLVFFWGASSPLRWFNNKEFLCITHTVEHNCISPSSTVGIQLQPEDGQHTEPKHVVLYLLYY